MVFSSAGVTSDMERPIPVLEKFYRCPYGIGRKQATLHIQRQESWLELPEQRFRRGQTLRRPLRSGKGRSPARIQAEASRTMILPRNAREGKRRTSILVGSSSNSQHQCHPERSEPDSFRIGSRSRRPPILPPVRFPEGMRRLHNQAVPAHPESNTLYIRPAMIHRNPSTARKVREANPPAPQDDTSIT